MKKLISAICALGLCLGLAACNQQPAETAVSATETKETTEATAAVTEAETEAPETEQVLIETGSDYPDLHVEGYTSEPSPDWVKALPEAQDASVNQLFIVAASAMDKTTAYITMHERDENGEWIQILSTPGFVGKNGCCLDADHAEGCGQTPVGRYHFTKAFGIAPDPGCAMDYFQVTDDTYWSGDMNEGMHYNEMVDIKDYPNLDLENSEHIVDYEYQYQYCLNISFNEDGTLGRGSAIFLHCYGLQKPYTGGCVAVPEYSMVRILQNVSADCVVIIDTMEALNASF